jgi:hypothetical protein
MSNIKSFCLALTLIPISLSTFQAPALAQFTLSPSKGLAGSASGNNGLSLNYIKNGKTRQITLSPRLQKSLNVSASKILTALGSVNETLKTVLIEKSSLDFVVLPARFAEVKDLFGAGIASMLEGSSGLASTGNRLSDGITDVLISRVNGPGFKIALSNGKTLTLDSSAYKDPTAAITSATAVLSAGGSVAEATLAASLAGTGADPLSCISLVRQMSGLFAGGKAAKNTDTSLPITIPTALLNNRSLLTATGLRTKSLDLEKDLIAQTPDTLQIDANQLNNALIAYNELIDKSSPEAITNLTQNEDFKLIGDTLRQLRDSVR